MAYNRGDRGKREGERGRIITWEGGWTIKDSNDGWFRAVRLPETRITGATELRIGTKQFASANASRLLGVEQWRGSPEQG
jgi:hypothetical protein